MTPPASEEPARQIDPRPRQPGAPLQPTWRTSPQSHRLRAERLRPYVAGKDVLDVGCASGVSHNDWLHARIAASAKSAVGIDLDEAAARRAAQKGFDVRYGDAEKLEVEGRFDVVVAGEIIEHLSRPGDFLEGVKRVLRSDGLLVLTTPNAFAISNFVYRTLGEPTVNGDHVAWFCPVTLRQLLERHDFVVVEDSFLPHITPGLGRARVAAMVRRCMPERLRWGTLFFVARYSEGPAPVSGS